MQTFFFADDARGSREPRTSLGTSPHLSIVSASKRRRRREVLVGFTYMGKTLNIYPKDAAVQYVRNGIPIDERSEP